jgi:hypothetical protein
MAPGEKPAFDATVFTSMDWEDDANDDIRSPPPTRPSPPLKRGKNISRFTSYEEEDGDAEIDPDEYEGGISPMLTEDSEIESLCSGVMVHSRGHSATPVRGGLHRAINMAASERMDPFESSSQFMRVPVCSFKPQTAWPSGSLMCSTCSTTVALAWVSGLTPDPGTIAPEACARYLDVLMAKSSEMQTRWVENMRRGGLSPDMEKRQVAEIYALVASTDKEGCLRVGGAVECFGPLRHDQVDASEVRAAQNGEEGASCTLLENAASCIIRGLDRLLATAIPPGSAFALTFWGHTVTVYVPAGLPKRWYIMDPLPGTVVCIVGDSGAAFHALMKCRGGERHAGRLQTGLEVDQVYTGMIFTPRPSNGAAAPPPSPITISDPPTPSQPAAGDPQPRSTVQKNRDVMRVAQDCVSEICARALGSGDVGIVAALRSGSNSARASVTQV